MATILCRNCLKVIYKDDGKRDDVVIFTVCTECEIEEKKNIKAEEFVDYIPEQEATMYELVYFVNCERFTKKEKDFGAVLKLAKELPFGVTWLVFNPKGVLLYTDKDEQALFNK